jgi:pilus assembly protein CpaE
VSVSVAIIESGERDLALLARGAGLMAATHDFDTGLMAIERSGAVPDVLVVDLRKQDAFPSDLAAFKRRHARTGVVIVVASLDPRIMLDAMRAGVTEVVHEPLTSADLRAAIDRVVGHQTLPSEQGRVIGFIGAKGGVGTTTLAVNVAAALAAEPGATVLMADLHITGHGDAAVFLGVEPRFSIVDALENVHRLDRAFLNTLVVRAKSGIDVLASPERPSLRHPEGAELRGLLDRLASNYTYVVLDLPKTDLALIDAVEPVAVMSLVVNQELPTVRRAAQIGGLLRQRYGKDRVAAVVSRYDPRAEIGQEDIERVIGLPVWSVLPSDYRRAVAAANVGQPLVREGQSRLGSAIQLFARRVAGPSARVEVKKPVVKAAGRLGGIF